MAKFSDLEIDQMIYIIENDPVTILELKIVGLGYDEEYHKRIKVSNSEITFEVDFDNIVNNVFIDKNQAYSVATKFIFDETNQFIRDLTDGHFQDYFDLDKAMEKYKILFPELFI